MAYLALENAGITFHINQFGRLPFKDLILGRLFGRRPQPVREVRALHDINLSVQEGERVGILGHNGAGKSTLLKLLAGIYPATTGQRVARGKISSLFDISLGFESDATGYQNIMYRGYLQRETPRSIRAKMREIAEFSELGEFLDLPIRCYSAGMRVRLAFAIATAIEPEILLIDEALGAGDLAFFQKARQRIDEILGRAKIVVMVSHDLTTLANMCQKLIWLDHGAIRAQGAPAEIIKAYTRSVIKAQPAPAAAA